MKRLVTFIMLFAMLAGILAGCAPQTVEVIVTKEVPVEVEVIKEVPVEVIVTKEVMVVPEGPECALEWAREPTLRRERVACPGIRRRAPVSIPK